MPKLTTIKTNFTAGELSPRLLARVDVAKHANGAKEMYNAYPLVHGGGRRRPGTRYLAAAKHSDKQTRLIPFIFSKTQAFYLEYGDGYVRFFTGAGRIEVLTVPVEVVSPYLEADLDDVHFVHRADTLFNAHPDYPIQRLVRASNVSWKMGAVDWDVEPTDEIGEKPSTILTLGALTGAGVSATASAAAFAASDIGRTITAGASSAVITGYTSNVLVTVTVVDNFTALAQASGAWTITESPKVGVTPSATGPIGAAITLTAAAAAWKNNPSVSHVGSFVEINDGLVEVTGFTSDLILNGIVRTELATTTASPSEGWALRQPVWNAANGYPRAITLHKQRLIAGGSNAYPKTLWGTKVGEYYNFAEGVADTDGFTFELTSDEYNPIEHLTATKALLPLTSGGAFSVKGGVEKPITPTNVDADDESGYGADTPRPVRVGNEVVYVEDGLKRIRAIGYRVETDAFNAPDISVLAEHITGDGVFEMAYCKKPDQVVWMPRADGAAVSMTIDRDQDVVGFAASFTDGLFESVASIPYLGVDQLGLVAVREINGATVRYIEVMEEGLQTDCAITGEVDEEATVSATWLAGVVTINQVAHGYADGDVIRLSGFTPTALNGEQDITYINANSYSFELADDPGATTVVGTAAKAALVWGGAGHLEAKTVDIVADGYVAKQQVVTGAQVTLERAAYAVEIGLHYDSRIVTLPPEVGTGTGTAQGNALSIHEIIVRFYKSKGGTVNGQPVLSRKFSKGPVLNRPVPEFTGDKPVENLGWGKAGSGDSDGSITIEQTQPLPQQVLGVITRLTVNDG